MASTIQVRVDDDLKRKSDMLFKDLGTDTTSAIKMFLTLAVANNGFPFEIRKRDTTESNPYRAMTEEELLEKLRQSREHCEEGRCREADMVISDLRGKYGL
ncbi:MAG: type II toxin-antitoxin system RelB/DinJ family antitoxin [Lachnospiraceae bacterium]|nr:type II toxin-antitoxin system RelB/DinJ family antitoxin [Lachnospiraceae bacterium]